LIDGGIEFLSGVREGELAYIYYPEGEEAKAKVAKEISYKFMNKPAGFEFLIALEGGFSIIRMGVETPVEGGRYLIAQAGLVLPRLR